jgi:hypothetical protein
MVSKPARKGVFIRAFQDSPHTMLFLVVVPFEADKTGIIEPLFYTVGSDLFS